ncbi:hypothetical protein BGZ73_007271 [Actinomortierella ambigua]|nr:hypothetical protein BGZ73_007271 [Actinomortierella ambigua]
MNDLIADPLKAIQKLYATQAQSLKDEEMAATEFGVPEFFATWFDTQEKIQQVCEAGVVMPDSIPLVDVKMVDTLPPYSLVRFRGMVQDTELGQDVALFATTTTVAPNGEEVRICHRFADSQHSEKVPAGSTTETIDLRNSYFCVSTPGATDWTRRSVHHDNVAGALSDQIGSLSLSSATPGTAPERFPFPNTEHTAVIVKRHLVESNELSVADMVEVIGVLGAKERLPVDDYAPVEDAAAFPTIHAITVKKILDHGHPDLDHDGPKDVDVEQVQQSAQRTRGALIDYLSAALYGDKLAAELVLLHLLARVHTRTNGLVLGKFSLNLKEPTAQSAAFSTLSKALASILPKFYALPLSLKTLNDHFFFPRGGEALSSGILQVTKGTSLLLDETAMAEGTLNDKGVKNVKAVSDVSVHQTLGYVFPFNNLDISTDISLLIISSGSSLIPVDCSLKLKHGNAEPSVQEVTESRLMEFRKYLSVLRVAEYKFSEEIAQEIETEFMQQRKEASAQGTPLMTPNELAFNVGLASAKWLEIFGNPDTSLEALKARAISPAGDLGSDGIRSVCWKIYLSILPTLDLSSWPAILAKEREEYSELHRKYIRAIGSEDNTPNLEVNNPLSLAEDSPWQQFFVDSELKKVIRQDVERTFPDNDYFRSQKVQDQLTDILFIYCKIHHDVSYRQGMHELLAHMLWVVSSESLDVSDNVTSTTSSDPVLDAMKNVLDANYIEHDTFILFSRLMVAAKPWYEFSDEGLSSKKQRSLNMDPTLFGRPDAAEDPGKPTPVIEWSMRIFNYLKRIDIELFNHLTSLEIQPQLFGIRWFRLLFGREFPMDDVLIMWDGIFSVDPDLKITPFIGLAMLIYIRDDLLESDFSMCLHKLMRYPPCKDVRNFIKQGIYLQSHPTAQGGAELIRQNYLIMGKPLPPLPQQHESYGDDARHSRDEDRSHSPHPQHNRQYPHHRDHHERNHGRVLSGNGGIVPHLPPAALEAIKPVTEGFVNVTKNVLESKGGVALNRAIHDMKKSTQSYIRKAGPNTSHQDTQPIFPPMFDQAVASSARLAAQSRPATSQPTKIAPALNKQPPNSLNAQLGQVVAKAITILEAELSQLPRSKPEDAESTPNTDAHAKGPSKAGLAALIGLEHARDILLGHSMDWNPLVIESAMLDLGETQEVASPQQHQQQQLDTNGRRSPSLHRATASPSPSPSHSALKPAETRGNNAKGGAGGSTVPSSSPSPRLQASRIGESSADTAKQPKDRHHRISLHGDARKHVASSVSPSSASVTGAGATYATTSATTSVSSPAVSTPIPAPVVKNARPFSFDDLLGEDNEAAPLGGGDLSQSSPSLAAKWGQLHDDPLSKTKSPRSLLANSQFSWMVGSHSGPESVLRSSSFGGSGSGSGSSYLTSHRNASATDIHQDGGGSSGASPQLLHPRTSIDGLRGRMKLDPLAGAVTKSPPPAGGAAAATVAATAMGAGSEGRGPFAERTGHDPLQELST